MANPSPPPANYPPMSSRAGYSDGQVLTTAELNQACAYLTAQNGSGTEQQMWCRPVGANGYLIADPQGAVWLAYNGFYDQGTSAWWPVNSQQPAYAIRVTAAGIAFYYAAANASAFTWLAVDTLSSVGWQSVLAIASELSTLFGDVATLDNQVAALIASLAQAGTFIFASTSAAEASSSLANGAYYYIPSTQSGGALDLYEKLSSSSSNYVTTLPALGATGSTPASYGAPGDGVDFVDVSIAANGTTATSASGIFATAVVGQEIVIRGSGPNGAALSTTIASVAGAPNSVTVASAASTTVAGATGFFGTDETSALRAWANASVWHVADPTKIHVISSSIAIPALVTNRLRVRMTSAIGSGEVGLTTGGGASIGTAQIVSGVSCGATQFVSTNNTLFQVGGLFHLASNQIFGLDFLSTLGEVGVVKSLSNDGVTVVTVEPIKFSYENFRVALLQFASGSNNTPGASYAAGDYMTLSGGTLQSQPVIGVNTTANTIEIGIAAPIFGMLDHWTGAAFQFASTGTLPGGLSPATNYYVGNVNLWDAQGAFVCQLFTNQSDALNGYGSSLVTLTSAGMGTITCTTAFQIQVCSVSGTGAILTWRPVSWGSYSALPSLPASFSTTGSGTGAQAQVLTLESCSVTPVVPITPDLDLEVQGDASTSHAGFEIYYAKGGRVRGQGGWCGDREAEFTSCIDTLYELGNTHDCNGQSTSYGLSINGACKRMRVKGTGIEYLNRHGATTNNTTIAAYSGIPIDTVFEELHIGSTSPYPSSTVAVTNVDYTSGANTITIAGVLTRGLELTISSTGSLPGGLPSNTPIYAGNVIVNGNATTFVPYQDYDDALLSLGNNVYTLTGAGTGTITAILQAGGDAMKTHPAMLNTTFLDCVVESSTNCCFISYGGGLRVIGCTARNPVKHGINFVNDEFYACANEVDDTTIENAGEYGLYMIGGAYLKDRLKIGRVTTRGSAICGVYIRNSGAAGSPNVQLEHGGSIRSHMDLATNPNASGAVYLYNVETGALPDVFITGLPSNGIGLRLSGVYGGKTRGGRIVAGAKGARLVYVSAGSSHLVLDNLDLDDAGFSNVVGFDLADSTISNIAVGPRNDLHNMSPNLGASATGTWLQLSSGAAADNIDIRSEWFVPVTHAMSPYTAPNGRTTLLCNSSAGTITVSPPASPAATDSITIADDAGTAQTNAITFGGTVGANDDTAINRQGDVNRYAYSVGQTHWKQMQ